jgi:CheY-like chemotaxis protein
MVERVTAGCAHARLSPRVEALEASRLEAARVFGYRDVPWYDTGVRVLVLERNDGLRSLFASELEEAGLTAVQVDTWEAGLQSVLSDPPDAIVVDATLAPENGVAFVRAIRTAEDPRLRNMPIVGLGWARGADRELLEAGVDCCVRTLPVPGDVSRAVRWALDVYRGRTAATKS